jgi:hypothetical protein
MVWDIGPVSEYEAQSTMIHFIGIIIQQQYELRQQCHFIVIVGVLRQRKQADFSRRQNVLLVVRSQYRY